MTISMVVVIRIEIDMKTITYSLIKRELSEQCKTLYNDGLKHG